MFDTGGKLFLSVLVLTPLGMFTCASFGVDPKWIPVSFIPLAATGLLWLWDVI